MPTIGWGLCAEAGLIGKTATAIAAPARMATLAKDLIFM
jgi:hypothetical protein